MEFSLFPTSDSATNKVCAFIDEKGDYGFNFNREDASSHFIITAIIIEEKEIHTIKENCEKIWKSYFSKEEITLPNVSNNDGKREKILIDIAKLNFTIFSIIVDKRKFRENSNIKLYKKTFFRFMNRLIDRELHGAYPDLELARNEYENKEFMGGFKKYIEEKYPLTLFGDQQFGFVDNKDRVLIQLAAFIGDTIRISFEGQQKNQKSGNLLSIIKHKITVMKEWPQSYETYTFDIEKIKNPEFNEAIAQHSLKLENDFIKNNANSLKPEIQDQVRFLKFLEFYMKYISANKYISTNEILSNFDAYGKNLTKHYLRTSIVAKIRDSGVLIASSPYGYKLPVSEKEIYDFVNHSSTIVMPMLTRLCLCREAVKKATHNQLDILDKSEYKDLKRYFEANQ